MTPASWLRRLRHSGGFGVHSPFAYAFITDVLRLRRYAYYAYDEVGSPELRLWFRIVCRFQPATVADPAGAGGEYLRVARLAVPGCRLAKPAEADLVHCRRQPAAAPRAGQVVVADGCSGSDADRLFGSAGFGMCFTNRSGRAVMVALPHLPHQRFDLFF